MRFSLWTVSSELRARSNGRSEEFQAFKASTPARALIKEKKQKTARVIERQPQPLLIQ